MTVRARRRRARAARPRLARIEVDIRRPSGSRSYPIAIGPGALDELPRTLARLAPSRIHVVTDRTVWAVWGGRILAVLRRAGPPVARTVLPAGERSKSAAVLGRLWRDIVRAGCDRRSVVVAFGGGVVGDVAGLAAATALRGIDLVQVPTTLLAMVDSSVGGKTAIDIAEGKNLVGAFHQPRAVIVDLDLLRTLPPRQARCGWAEVIKTAAIADASLFRFLEVRRRDLLAGDPEGLRRAVAASCRVKADVVGRDEREGGPRMLLNFGHTLGHGIEAALGYRSILHGEAVAAGMAFAARLGEALGRTRPGTADRLERLLAAFGLPVAPPAVPVARCLAAMGRDKKRGSRGLRWVLLEAIGKAAVHADVPWEAVREALARFGR